MIYLSQLFKVPVKDSSEVIIGRLTDILIKPESGKYAPLAFLLVKNKSTKKEFFIPYEFVSNIGKSEVTLKHLGSRIPEVTPGPEYVRLQKDIMDEQIVDVKGARIVRVNDLRLGSFENVMCVLGIDVSFRGILRRLGVEWLDVFHTLNVNLIDWREAQLIEGELKLNTVSEELKRLHPADLANIIEDLSLKQGSSLVDSLESSTAAQVVEEIDPELQTSIMHYLGPERAADILEKMSVDETVDLLQNLPKKDAQKYLEHLKSSKSKKVKKLFKYDEDEAGGIMTTDYVEVEPEWTVQRAFDEIRRISPEMRSILYVYIVSDSEDLLGVISLRTLIVSDPNDKVSNVMKQLPEGSMLRVDQKVSDIIRVMTKYNLYSAVVLDEKNKMAGVVTLDDVMRFVAPNA